MDKKLYYKFNFFRPFTCQKNILPTFCSPKECSFFRGYEWS